MATRRSVTLTIIVFTVCTTLIAGGAITGFKVSSLAASLARVVTFTDTINKDVAATDLPALSADLTELNRLTQDTLVAASDPTLSAAFGGIPFAGRHLDAARTIASAVSGLTSAAQPLAKLLPRLEPSVLVTNGQYNTATLASLDDAINEINDQLAISNKQIAGIDLDTLDRRVVDLVDKLAPALINAQTLLGQLEPLAAILPIMLDSSEGRTWFVALQNLTEARGTGGIFGAYAILDVNNGALKMTKSGSDNDLIPTPVPLDGLPEDFVGTQGENITDWRTINVSPNFPYTGQMVQNEWKAVSGQDVDGVVAFGQGIVQYLLAATGPVTIDGTTVDAKNVVQFLSLGVYDKYPDAVDKNAFVSQLVAEIFGRLQTGTFDLKSLLAATGATPTSDRVLAWSPHDDVEKKIADAGLDGTIPDAYGPTALVTVNNGGGNKLEQFLNVSIDYRLGKCSADKSDHTRDATMTITLTNNAPTSGLPAYVTPREDYASTVEDKPVGSNLEVLSVYLPVGAEEGDTTLDGEDEFAYIGTVQGRDELAFGVDLNPGQSKTVVVPWTEPTVGPEVVDMVGAQAAVITQPSLNPITVTTPSATTCP